VRGVRGDFPLYSLRWVWWLAGFPLEITAARWIPSSMGMLFASLSLVLERLNLGGWLSWPVAVG